MNWFARMIGWALALTLVLVITIVMVGPQRFWSAIAGDPDLGRQTLATLERSGSLNDALLAPRNAVTADVDDQTPIFALAPEDLYARLIADVDALGTVEWTEQDQANLYARGITRSPLMKFPDTNHIWVLPAGDAQSTLALYAAAQLGTSDLGKNRERLETWLDLLDGVPRVEITSR